MVIIHKCSNYAINNNNDAHNQQKEEEEKEEKLTFFKFVLTYKLKTGKPSAPIL